MASCTHQHDCEEHECAADWSLFKSIDLPGVEALNEAVDGSAKSIFKPWEHRLDFSTAVESDDDDPPELIIFIPFTTDVKIKSISVVGGAEGTSPVKMRVPLADTTTEVQNGGEVILIEFHKQGRYDFLTAGTVTAIQEWELAENYRGELEYPTKYPRFQGVSSLTIHFPGNFGATKTHIHYIGLRGDATNLKRDVVASIVYEAMPNPSEHQLLTSGTPHQIV